MFFYVEFSSIIISWSKIDETIVLKPNQQIVDSKQNETKTLDINLRQFNSLMILCRRLCLAIQMKWNKMQVDLFLF